MMRILLLFLLLAAAGVAAGWYLLPGGSHAPSPDEGLAGQALVPVSHSFRLTEADLQGDREKPALAVDGQGRVLLAWASITADDEYTLFLARSADGGFTFEEPQAFRKVPLRRYTAFMRGKEVSRSTVVLPRLAASGDGIVLAWTEPHEGTRIRLLTARSSDGGRTFSEPVVVSGPDAERTSFTALGVGADGSAACAWIEKRFKAPQPFCTVSDKTGKFNPEKLVYAGPDDRGICPCCDLDVARTTDGRTLVAFRNASDGHRDIYLARSRDAAGTAFEAPVRVGTRHWEFDGCPHDGPSLAVVGKRVHVCWMDASTGKRRISLASADVADLAFTEQDLGLAPSAEQGHPRLAAGADGVLHVIWDQSFPGDVTAEAESGEHRHGRLSGSGRVICYMHSVDAEQPFTLPQALAPEAGVFQLQPTLAVGPQGTPFAAWVEMSDDGKEIVFARLSGGVCGSCCVGTPSRGSLLSAKGEK
jgi:hypothetical protein